MREQGDPAGWKDAIDTSRDLPDQLAKRVSVTVCPAIPEVDRCYAVRSACLTKKSHVEPS